MKPQKSSKKKGPRKPMPIKLLYYGRTLIFKCAVDLKEAKRMAVWMNKCVAYLESKEGKK